MEKWNFETSLTWKLRYFSSITSKAGQEHKDNSAYASQRDENCANYQPAEHHFRNFLVDTFEKQDISELILVFDFP